MHQQNKWHCPNFGISRDILNEIDKLIGKVQVLSEIGLSQNWKHLFTSGFRLRNATTLSYSWVSFHVIKYSDPPICSLRMNFRGDVEHVLS
jgi:hypothetical protein